VFILRLRCTFLDVAVCEKKKDEENRKGRGAMTESKEIIEEEQRR
jgi:hypothetical protein